MQQVSEKITDEVEFKPPDFPSGRLIIEYLQNTKDGATMGEILQHLRNEYGKDSEELTGTVLSVLENGTALGFLERKGSHYVNWSAREACCKRRRRRRSCCRRRRRRKICRRRSCCPRRKRRRRC